MHQSMLFIEAGSVLYRGFGQRYPALRWRPEVREWTTCEMTTPQADNWGELITVREAERLFPGCSSAPTPLGIETTVNFDGAELSRYRPELFDGYDGPMYRLSPDEEEEQRAAAHQETTFRPA